MPLDDTKSGGQSSHYLFSFFVPGGACHGYLKVPESSEVLALNAAREKVTRTLTEADAVMRQQGSQVLPLIMETRLTAHIDRVRELFASRAPEVDALLSKQGPFVFAVLMIEDGPVNDELLAIH